MNWKTLLVLYGFLAVTIASQIYRKAGETLSLTPNQPPASTSISIVWKHNNNKVVDWDEGSPPVAYAQFRGRTQLNTSTGELVVTDLNTTDSGLYTVEVDGKVEGNTSAVVLNPVPKPTIHKTCKKEEDDAVVSCTLSCEGEATDAGKVDYQWRKDETTWAPSNKDLTILTGEDSGVKTFTCKLKNQVGEKDSEPLYNPLAPATVRIKTGLVVGISLVTVLIVIVLSHRCRTGAWFFNKGSMPWEADFWKKGDAERATTSGRQTSDRGVPNGDRAAIDEGEELVVKA